MSGGERRRGFQQAVAAAAAAAPAQPRARLRTKEVVGGKAARERERHCGVLCNRREVSGALGALGTSVQQLRAYRSAEVSEKWWRERRRGRFWGGGRFSHSTAAAASGAF